MDFIDKKEQEFLEPQPQPAPKQSKPANSSKDSQLTNEIKALVKVETAKIYNTMQKELSQDAIKMAEDLALGLTDDEVIDKWKIKPEILEQHWSNPMFVSEYNKMQFNVGFANEQMRVRGMNRILQDMFTEIVSRPMFMSTLPAEKLLDLFMKANLQMDKQIKGDIKPIYLDSVQIINNFIRDEKRITENSKGEITITSEYETLDTVELKKNKEGIYE